MFKKVLILAALVGACVVTPARDADAGIYVRRFAPVRRVAYRAALPPYPVARRAVVGPVYAPYYRPYYGGYGYGYGYGPGVAISIGY